MAFILSAQTGNYSNPATWVGGVVPTTGDIAIANYFTITVDVQPLATLSTARQDIVDAGGTDQGASVASGRFIFIDGCNFTTPFALRPGRDCNVVRTSISSSPFYMTNGTVNISSIEIVHLGTVTAELQCFAVNPAASTTANLTIGDVTVPHFPSSTNFSISSVIQLMGANNSTFNVVINGDYTTPGTRLGQAMRFIYTTDTVAAAYNITINSNIPPWDAISSGGLIHIRFTSTSAANQNIIINSAAIGDVTINGTTSAVVLEANNAHSLSFTNTTGCIIGNASHQGSGNYEIYISSLRGTLSASGPLTFKSSKGLRVATGTSTVNLQDLSFSHAHGGTNLNSLAITTSGQITLGNIELGTFGIISSTSSVYAAIELVTSASVTVNGDITYTNTGNQGSLALKIESSAATSAPITINGDIDCRNKSVQATSILTSTVYIGQHRNGQVVVNGNVYGSNIGTATSPSLTDAAIGYSDGGIERMPCIINGNVYGGSYGSAICIKQNVTPALVDIIVNGTIHGSSSFGVGKTGAPGVFTAGKPVYADNIKFGPDGQFPVYGRLYFNNVTTGTVEVRDDDNNAVLMSSSGVTVPSPADVRFGVAVGNSTGTLVVPQPSTVLLNTAYDNGKIGTLSALNVTPPNTTDFASRFVDIRTKVLAARNTLESLTINNGELVVTIDNDNTVLETNVSAIKAKTDQLTFTANGVVAEAASSGSTTGMTARFDALDTVTAAIKAKTDQLAFGVNGVNANLVADNYTARFNSLDAAVAAIPTITYSSRLDSIDADLNALVAGGGVDFTPVLDAISVTNNKVDSVQATSNGIKSTTDQLTFGADGVNADVSVSVNNSINYDSRFDALDLSTNAIRAKTNQLTFGMHGVEATANFDTAPIISSIVQTLSPQIAAVATNLNTHDDEIKAQLTTIQNATGAIDLTPILTSIATVNNNVLNIPTSTYATRFNAVDAALVSIQTDVDGLSNIEADLTKVKNLIVAI